MDIENTTVATILHRGCDDHPVVIHAVTQELGSIKIIGANGIFMRRIGVRVTPIRAIRLGLVAQECAWQRSMLNSQCMSEIGHGRPCHRPFIRTDVTS